MGVGRSSIALILLSALNGVRDTRPFQLTTPVPPLPVPNTPMATLAALDVSQLLLHELTV